MSGNTTTTATDMTHTPPDHESKPLSQGHEEAGYTGTGGNVGRYTTSGGHPVDTSQPAFPVYHRKFGDPAPLGLLSFSTTLFVLCLYIVQARNVATPNIIVGMALFYAGVSHILVSVEAWAGGNTFVSTVFASYAGFWFSFACLYIPSLGIVGSFASVSEFNSAFGLFLAGWGVLTFGFLVAALRSSVALIGIFFFLDITFWCLCGGYLGDSLNAIKAGGSFGILTAAIAAYTGFAGLLTSDTSYFTLPVGDLSGQ